MPTRVRRNIRPQEELSRAERVLAGVGIGPARQEAELLLAHVQGCARWEVYLREGVLPSARARFRRLVRRREDGEPLQYCMHTAWFYGESFTVGPGAFIPRQETEVLVAYAIERLRELRRPARVYDLCCGPGTMGITLTKNVSDCRITAIDCSGGALAYARENAGRLGVADRITFMQQDIRRLTAADIAHMPRADMVIANPPYIPSALCRDLPREVLREPLGALDGGADGLDWYRVLIPRWHRVLQPGGFLLMEHGDGQAPDVEALVRDADAYDEIIGMLDMSGRKRIVAARVAHG